MNNLNNIDYKNLTDISKMYNSNYISKVLLEAHEGDYAKIDKMEDNHKQTLKKFMKVYNSPQSIKTIQNFYKVGGAVKKLTSENVFNSLKLVKGIAAVGLSLVAGPLGDTVELVIPALIETMKTEENQPIIDEGLAQLLIKISAVLIRNSPGILQSIDLDPATKKLVIKAGPVSAKIQKEINQILIDYKGPTELSKSQQQLQQQVQPPFTPVQQFPSSAPVQQFPPSARYFPQQQQGGEISECSFSMDLTNLSETSYQKGGRSMNFSQEIDLIESEFSLADILGSRNKQQQQQQQRNYNIDTENYTLSEFNLADILRPRNKKQQGGYDNVLNLSHLLQSGGKDSDDTTESLEEILGKIDAAMKDKKKE